MGFLIGWTAVEIVSAVFTAQNGAVPPIEFASSDLGFAAALILGAAVIASIPAALPLAPAATASRS